MKNKTFFKAVAVSAIILCIAFPQLPAGASAGSGMPDFADFIKGVMDGQADLVRGVYVPDEFAFPVVQQPDGDASSVTLNDGEITEFGAAAKNHVIGLLAHNTLAGIYFFNLRAGQEVRIIYGNAKIQYFIIDHLDRYEVMDSGKRDVSYKDLLTKKTYDTQALFYKFYGGTMHVTFQTCIRRGDDYSWGRLFVTAIPVPDNFFRKLKYLDSPENHGSLAITIDLRLMDGNALSW